MSPRSAPLTKDHAEANAPPMINYGWVYPQALLIFTITLVYSVVSPLILVFGAIYFGIACGLRIVSFMTLADLQISCTSTSSCSVGVQDKSTQGAELTVSLLQAIRIQWRGLATHLPPTAMGTHHIPALHDWNLFTPAAEGTSFVVTARHDPLDFVYALVVLDDVQRLWTLE